nr:Hypothetical protein CBG15349 [Haemonchus contortus]
MFRKPADDDYPRTVKAKPLPTKYAQKLAMTGKDFVTGGCEGGSGADSKHSACSSESSSANNSLTADERNKISAKILKAELKGDTETVNRLKRKLEGSTTQNHEETEKTVVLLKRDRSGNVVPCQRSKSSSENFAQTSSRIHREYGMKQGLNEMMLEEKSSTAEDQLMLFHRSIIKSAKTRRHDDESLDDIAEMQSEKRKNQLKDERRKQERSRKGEPSCNAIFDVAPA